MRRPGFWMVFALNEAGVPSHARIVKINVATNWNPAITPVLTNPGNQSGTWGMPTSLQLAATDPNGDELGYGASGLPPGLTIDATDGTDQRHADARPATSTSSSPRATA